MVRPSAFLIRGGGGYGDPLERAVEEVADDVRQGYVSIKAAAELYGVVVDPDTLVVDRAATERRRAARVPSAIAAVRHS
jgi:N-methylhydantoinase B